MLCLMLCLELRGENVLKFFKGYYSNNDYLAELCVN